MGDNPKSKVANSKWPNQKYFRFGHSKLILLTLKIILCIFFSSEFINRLLGDNFENLKLEWQNWEIVKNTVEILSVNQIKVSYKFPQKIG